MEDFQILLKELKKHPVLYTLLIIVAVVWSLLFYIQLIEEVNGIAVEIGNALAK